ncbi:acyltransferase family protein [Wenyingzhuangia sp. 2_MG-2023]|uniref:acyltransferase family protein n=1 Tax=Wenyingzhuangia sp. 2_MG-2023 TaxID=3062639 RepID=UPI0026E3E3E6|nr:acyltransferase family protein [Wenyingzhuangia sp. 2_MG-2023]MDO6739094.1 acyltransferase family protein [Wenyingzhuangia sp. 2_MG-2023]
MKNSKNNAIVNLRVLSLLQVFLLHYFAGLGMRNFLWVFSIAVPTFLLMSAYLYGLREQNTVSLGWSFLKKRWWALSNTYYLFLTFVFLFYLVSDYVQIKTYIVSFLAGLAYITNFGYYLPGCGHLWFMQVLMLCYIVLAFFGKNSIVKAWFSSSIKTSFLFLGLLILGFVYRGNILVYLFFYMWLYFNANKLKLLIESMNTYLIVFLLIIGYCLLYTEYATNYNWGIYIKHFHTCIMALLTIGVFVKYKVLGFENKVIVYIGTLAMEIYLIHHLFVFSEPIYVSLPITIVLSIILHWLSNSLKNNKAK